MNVLLLSRSDDKTLLNFELQERYFEEIILKTENESKLLKIRKLREGILASKRVDLFALQVYEASVNECLAKRNFNELLLSLTGLMKLYGIIQGERRDEIAAYYLLFFGAHNAMEVILLLKGLDQSVLLGDRVKFALSWIKAISTSDYYALARLCTAATTNEEILIQSSLISQRPRIVEMLLKSYFTLPIEKLLSYLILPDNSASLVIVEKLIPIPIKADGSVELKRRKR